VAQLAYSEKLSHQCLIRIQSVYLSLKSAEKKAADFILADPEFISGATITEAAERIGCSDATLVRIARRLGYSGYSVLKTSVIPQEEQNLTTFYEHISEEDEPFEVVHKVFQTAIQSIQDTLDLVDSEQYAMALSAIEKAGRILFIGAGDAYTVAYAGFLKFSRIGINCGVERDLDLQLTEAAKLKPNDLLVVVSHSGRTQSLYEVVKYAKTRNAKILAITNYQVSPIAKNADIILLTATFVSNVYGEIMTKRIPELCLIETLYVNAVMRGGRKASIELSNWMEAISINKI